MSLISLGQLKQPLNCPQLLSNTKSQLFPLEAQFKNQLIVFHADYQQYKHLTRSFHRILVGIFVVQFVSWICIAYLVNYIADYNKFNTQIYNQKESYAFSYLVIWALHVASLLSLGYLVLVNRKQLKQYKDSTKRIVSLITTIQTIPFLRDFLLLFICNNIIQQLDQSQRNQISQTLLEQFQLLHLISMIQVALDVITCGIYSICLFMLYKSGLKCLQSNKDLKQKNLFSIQLITEQKRRFNRRKVSLQGFNEMRFPNTQNQINQSMKSLKTLKNINSNFNIKNNLGSPPVSPINLTEKNQKKVHFPDDIVQNK